MGRFFSDPVEQALKYIYYDLRAGRGQEGFQLLQQAVQDGDADACCLLGPVPVRTGVHLAGPQFPRGRAGGRRADAPLRAGRQRHRGAAVPALRRDGPAAGPGHAHDAPGGL